MPNWFFTLTWPQALVLTAGFIALGGLILAAGEIGAAAIGRNMRVTLIKGNGSRK